MDAIFINFLVSLYTSAAHDCHAYYFFYVLSEVKINGYSRKRLKYNEKKKSYFK